MDIDALFKTPKVPSGSLKRRMPDNPTPEMLKKMRLENAPSSPVTPPLAPNKGKGRAATVEDITNDEDEEMEFAPGGDADYFKEEDDEGRMFGSGLTDQQKQILNIFDSGSGEGGVAENLEEMGITGIRQLLLKFERAVKKNQDQRSKYPDDASKFMDSEADLDGAIKSLLPLAQFPVLAYPEIVKSGAIVKLVDLMSHENADIAIDVVELIHELTDEDVGEEGDDDDDDDDEQEGSKEEALKFLIESLLEHQILELLVANLARLKEDEESDRQGVFHTLGIFENVIGFNPSLAGSIVTKTTILAWLLERIQSKNHDENRGYAGELLAILLQGTKENRLKLGELGGVDTILKVLSQYRRRDPVDADEIEFMENVFDALCSALTEAKIKKLFLEDEGVELMVFMMKEKMLSRSRSIKVLDHAMSGQTGTRNCEQFVDVVGLKYLFPALMNKGKKTKNSGATPPSEDTSHILGILSSLFTNLASDSAPRLRLLTKFVEGEYEKVERLLEIRDFAEGRLKETDREIAEEKAALTKAGEEIGADETDLWYLRRVDGGLFTLQTVDYILGWVCMEDDGARAHAQLLLGRKGRNIQDIVKVLQEFHDNVEDEPPLEEGEAGDGESAPPQRMILQGLIQFLESC